MDEAQIQAELAALKQRNARVEADKAWEVSWARRLFLAAGIYLVAGLWLSAIVALNPWQNAIVPALGYLLSTLSLPFVKRWWQKRIT